MKKIIITVTLIFPYLLPAQISIQDSLSYEWTEYCNLRFNFCLTYPVEEWSQTSNAANGDGAVFSTPDEAVQLTITGSNNLLNWTPEDIYQLSLAPYREDKKFELQKIFADLYKNGFEAQFKINEKLIYFQMIQYGDNYVLLNVEGPFDDRALVEAMIEDLQVEVN